MITEKHLAICASLNAPKSQYNSFGKYSYRSCEDILEAVKPLLVEYGAMLHITDDIHTCGDWVFVVANAWLSDAETGEKSEVASAFARVEDSKKGMDGSQITGTASSYARKYALNALLLIDDSKDADTDEHKQTQKPIAQTFKETLEKTARQFGCSEQDVKDVMGMAGISKMGEGIQYMETAMRAGTLVLGLEE